MEPHGQPMDFATSTMEAGSPYKDTNYCNGSYTEEGMKHQTNPIYSNHPGHQAVDMNCDPHRISMNTQETLPEMKPPERNQSIQKIDFINKFYGQELLATLQKLLREEKFCDTILSLGDKHIKVHGIILSILSPFFQNSRSQIASPSSCGFSIDLPHDIHVECLKVFVSYIYTGDISVTMDNLRDMYRLAKIFQIKFLNDCCESFAWQAKLENIMNHYDTSPELMAVRASLRELKFSKVDRNHDTNDLMEYHDKAIDTQDLMKTIRQAKASKRPAKPKKTDNKIKTEVTTPSKPILSITQPHPPSAALPQFTTVSVLDLEANKSAKCHKYGTRAALAPPLTDEQKQDLEMKRKQKTEAMIGAQKKKTPAIKKKKIPVSEESNLPVIANLQNMNTNTITTEVFNNDGTPQTFDSERHTNVGIQSTNLPVSNVSTTGNRNDEVDICSNIPPSNGVTNGGDNLVPKFKKSEVNQNPLPNPQDDNNITMEILYKIVENEFDGEIDDKMPYEGQHPKQRYKMSMESEQTYARPPKKRMTVEMLEALTQSDNNSTEANIKDTQSPEPPSTNDTICAIDNEGAIGKRSAKKTSGEKAPKRRKRHSKNVDLDNVIVDMEQNAESIPESDRQYRCNLCANDFVFPKRCATHMLNTHDITEAEIMENITIGRKEVGPKSCDICGYVTKDQNYYYIHYHKYFRHGVPLPKGWKPFKCDICGKECFTKFQLKDHKLIHKEENPFMCETCGQGFKSRTCLNSHVFHRHNNERKHNCADCVKTFKTRTQLLVHRRIHTGEKPYHCPDCTYKSTTRGNMRLHLTNRHKYSNDTIKTLMYEMKTSAFTPSDDIPVEIKSVKGKSEPVGSTGVSEYPVTGCTVGVIDYNGQTSEPETPTANLERAVRMALAQGNQAVEGQLPNLDTISTSTTTTTTKPDDRIYGAQVPVDSNELHCTGQIFENLANPAMVTGNSQSNDIESNIQTGVLNTDSGNIAIQVAIIGDSGQLEASNINMEQFSNIQTYDPNQLQTVQNIVPSQALLQQLQQQLNQSGQVNQQPQLQIVHLQTPQQLQEAFRTLNQTDSNSLSQQIQQQITSPVQQQQQQTVQYQIKNLSPSAQAQSSTNAQHIVVSPETSEIPEDQGTLEEETYVTTSDITSTLSSLPTVITVAAQESSEQTNDESEQQNYDNAASMPSNQYESNIMQQAYYHAFYPHGYQ